MHGQEDRSALAHEAATDRREQSRVLFVVEPSPGRLREMLAEVDWHLVDLEHSSVGRVRLVLTEILGRSTGRDAQIRIEIFVLSETIRIELTGPCLALPVGPGPRGGDEPSFPSWLLTQLVDRWGIDHRKPDRSIWLLIDRA
jgi:hypothetical protein